MSEVQEIWMFHTGLGRINRTMIEAGVPRERCWLPILCFVLMHDDGPILVDTGLGARSLGRVRHPLVRLLGGLARLAFKEDMDCYARIAQCGVSPTDVARGVLTHLHWDHTGGLRDLPGTRFHVARRELSNASSQRGLRGFLRGYVPSDFEGVSNLEAFDWEGADDLAPFEAHFDLLGDSAVRLFPTPGHTPGHASILVRVEGGEVLLTGDAAFTQGQVLEQTGLGFMPRSVANDLAEARETLSELQAFVRRRPGLTILTSHDPDQGDDVVDGPRRVWPPE